MYGDQSKRRNDLFDNNTQKYNIKYVRPHKLSVRSYFYSENILTL